MRATIYVSQEAWALCQALKDIDYYDRCVLSDDAATDPTGKDGYYLKNANKLKLAPLPANAQIILRIHPGDAIYSKMVNMPVDLRGVIFEHAPHLPDRYAEIIRYWTGETVNSNVGNAAYYQNPAHAYDIDLSTVDADHELFSQKKSSPAVDALISESVVVSIAGLDGATAGAAGTDFVEIELPIDEGMLCLDNGAFMTKKGYEQRAAERTERIFLLVSDIRNSPDPARIFADVLRYEELDYGFYY
jgi:hypothetical protein